MTVIKMIDKLNSANNSHVFPRFSGNQCSWGDNGRHLA